MAEIWKVVVKLSPEGPISGQHTFDNSKFGAFFLGTLEHL